MIATVEYQVATYRGKIDILCKPNEETDSIIARAKRLLRVRSGGSLPSEPMGYESFRVIERKEQG